MFLRGDLGPSFSVSLTSKNLLAASGPTSPRPLSQQGRSTGLPVRGVDSGRGGNSRSRVEMETKGLPPGLLVEGF